MRHFLSVILLTLFVTATAYSQDDRKVRFAFAVMPSSGWFKPEGKAMTKAGSNIGFAYGVLADVRIGEEQNYAVSTGLMINSVGGKVNNLEYHDGRKDPLDTTNTAFFPGWANVEENYKLQYLDLPISLKLKTNELGYFTYFGQLGVTTSFNISSKRDLEGSYSDGTAAIQNDDKVSKDINLLRMGLQVGAGAEYNISGNTNILLAVLWNNGLTDVFSHSSDKNGTEVSLNNGTKFKSINNYLGLQIGVFF